MTLEQSTKTLEKEKPLPAASSDGAIEKEFLDFFSNVMDMAHTNSWTVCTLKNALNLILSDLDNKIVCPPWKYRVK